MTSQQEFNGFRNLREFIMTELAIDTEAVVEVLNTILETELAGVVRYSHYSLMVVGYGRIPIVS